MSRDDARRRFNFNEHSELDLLHMRLADTSLIPPNPERSPPDTSAPLYYLLNTITPFRLLRLRAVRSKGRLPRVLDKHSVLWTFPATCYCCRPKFENDLRLATEELQARFRAYVLIHMIRDSPTVLCVHIKLDKSEHSESHTGPQVPRSPCRISVQPTRPGFLFPSRHTSSTSASAEHVLHGRPEVKCSGKPPNGTIDRVVCDRSQYVALLKKIEEPGVKPLAHGGDLARNEYSADRDSEAESQAMKESLDFKNKRTRFKGLIYEVDFGRRSFTSTSSVVRRREAMPIPIDTS
ncbi:hypothetical protein OBBRIDRAFT_828388 [Obba rivulosa]|uniref:Uncharacterized protein n=1 Tax=Obba rivulosa TaxID=1052685 RepID=A0A8E2AVT8_9APHY|nr:hypothetical protein OBBRIDRAFT_828388 [Obba rivulosa]